MQMTEAARSGRPRPSLLVTGLLLQCVALVLLSGIVAAGDTQTIPIRGVIRAVRQATLTTEIPLRALELPFRESDRFKRGDKLAVFDCRRQKSDLDAAVATLREAVITLDSNIQLDRRQAIGRNDVEIARARTDKARADVDGLTSRMDECVLRAPFDGRIAELSLREHERTTPQRPFISILDDSELEIELIAASRMLADLQPGTAFTFRIDELAGRTVAAEVSRLGASVDPVSKTVKVMGIIKEPSAGILPGMSGSASWGPARSP